MRETTVTAAAARTTVQSPLRWTENPTWKLDYSNIERLSSEEIRRPREEFETAERHRQKHPRPAGL
jgi:hypothetical protein